MLDVVALFGPVGLGPGPWPGVVGKGTSVVVVRGTVVLGGTVVVAVGAAGKLPPVALAAAAWLPAVALAPAAKLLLAGPAGAAGKVPPAAFAAGAPSRAAVSSKMVTA